MSLRDAMLKRIQSANPDAFAKIDIKNIKDEELEQLYVDLSARSDSAPAVGRSIALRAAEVLRFFRGKGIEVQTAKPVTVKGEDGKERPAFQTKMVALAEEHIIAARAYEDRVAIVTIDGKRHEAATAA